MQCILLATDGSKSAERAADFAAQLAKAAEVPLWIATVTDDLGLSSAQLRAFSQAEHASRSEIIESIATQLLAKAETVPRRSARVRFTSNRAGATSRRRFW